MKLNEEVPQISPKHLSLTGSKAHREQDSLITSEHYTAPAHNTTGRKAITEIALHTAT